ncbi:MAG: CBS domain-containing protein [Anaerolineae bacterium]|nr:CBS domain-containing protein [Anaerolineae bacterium]
MPKRTVILPPDMPLTQAQEQLQIRPVAVVVENGHAVGLLSTADLARIAEILEVYERALPRYPA